MESALRPRSVIGTYWPVLLIAVSVLGLAAGSWLLIADPITMGVLWLAALPAAVAAVITARRSRRTAERERKLRAAVEADKIHLEEARAAWETEYTSQQRRLEAIEARLVDQAAALAWTPRPPDQAPVPAELLQRDEAVDRLIDTTTDRVFEALREGKYVRNDRFESRLFWDDVGTLVREVAAVYQPGADKAWLQTDARQLALAVHRAALRVSLRLEQLPTAPSSRKLADIVKWTETYRSGQSLLEYAKPLMTYVPWLYRLVRVLAGANPATLGLSVILFEIMKKAGFQISVEVMERYLKGLVREFLTAVGQEAANVYGGAYGRRSKAWVLGAEAVHLAREASESRAMFAAVVRLLDELELRDEVDRRALHRALVAPSFEPGRADWLPIEDRTDVLEKVEALFEAHPPAMAPRALARWKTGLESRLGHRSRLEIEGGTVHDQAQLESIARSLASWGRLRGAAGSVVHVELAKAAALAELEEEERSRLMQSVVDELDRVFDGRASLPRFDLTEPRKKAYIEDLIGLMGRLRPWGPEPDFAYIEEVARRFRLDPTKLRAQLGVRYVATLGEQLDAAAPTKKLPPGAAFAALVALDPDEQWDFAEDQKRLLLPTDASKDDKKVLRELQRELLRGAGLWLLASPQRAIVLRKADIQALSAASSKVVWEGRFADPSVRLERSKGLVRRSASAHGGTWSLPHETSPPTGLGLELSAAGGDRIAKGIEDADDRPTRR